MVTIMPLHHMFETSLRPGEAAAAVFVQSGTEPTIPNLKVFAQLYNLTNGELRFLEAYSSDVNMAKASTVLGITETTGKTHLRNIFAKTGVTRQADLIRLYLKFAPLLKS